MTFTLYFIRHGQTDWNATGRIQGKTDIPINDVGRGQAKHNGKTLVGISPSPHAFNFVASPLARPRETMEIIRKEMGLDVSDFATDDLLKEISFGKFEGLTYPEARAKYPEEYAFREQDIWNNAPPEGESYADLTLRVGEWFSSVNSDTVCVAHGVVSRVLRGIILNLSPQEVYELDVPQDKVLKVEAGQVEWI